MSKKEDLIVEALECIADLFGDFNTTSGYRLHDIVMELRENEHDGPELEDNEDIVEESEYPRNNNKGPFGGF